MKDQESSSLISVGMLSYQRLAHKLRLRANPNKLG